MEEEEELPEELPGNDAVIDPLAGLKPRQRRLAQLLAEGKTNSFIQSELSYSASRISILQNNPLVRAEVARLQDRLFEETIEERLKSMNEAALNHINFVLTDKTNRVKVTEKNEVAKWVIEMQKSKAPQVHDVGQNMLGVLLDRLDAKKTERTTNLLSSSLTNSSPQPPADNAIDVEHRVVIEQENPAEDELASWVDSFCDES